MAEARNVFLAKDVITPRYVEAMARYNAWQNVNLYDAASELTDTQRREDRGAFFRSIHATLNHILWADQMWLMRFGGAEPPAAKTIAEGIAQFEDWQELKARRTTFDAVIQNWAAKVTPADLDGNLEWYSASVGRNMSTPRVLTVMHLFNHQTHHRGQVHAMLTGFGIKPGVTDLPFGPPL